MNVNLFQNEQIESLSLPQHLRPDLSDDQINTKYTRGEVRIVTEQARYPLSTVRDTFSKVNYQLNPEYQRRHRWNTAKRSRLIESLIMNVPIPPVFLYEYEFSRFEVMDGLQRLSTIMAFYNDDFELEGMTEWSELNGRKYSTLPSVIRDGIDRRFLSAVILLNETASDPNKARILKQMVFERINSGGVKLTNQEARNAIYRGPLNDLCLELSENNILRQLWHISVSPELSAMDNSIDDDRLNSKAYREMEDVELVLRFFAYRQKHTIHQGTPLSVFLDNYLRVGNYQFGPDTLDHLRKLFEDTIELVDHLCGETAFYMLRSRSGVWKWYERPTTTIYDPLMFVASQFLGQRETLFENRSKFMDCLIQMYRDNYHDFEGRNVNPSALLKRDQLMIKVFECVSK